jgi:eukaryotic-like serine/threonine-protein kinase
VESSPNKPADTNPQAQQSTIEQFGVDPRIGLILDSKYKLVEHLGEGGMGSVFRAERLHIGDYVAVKLLHPDLVREPQALERFRREARSAAMIRHHNVVSIHDFSDGTTDGAKTSEAYIVMELLQGVSLGNMLRREGHLSPQRAVMLMQDICAGVGVAHRRGLLHRDLKPDNVIVSPPNHEGERETAKVVDFGLAKVRDVAAQTSLTNTGTVLGTLYYMSPEQCSGEELDARADVYSLGAMFYEMLSGQPPFRSGNVTGLITKHLYELPPAFPPELLIPPALGQVCFRALAKNKNDRQSDAVTFGRELRAALPARAAAQISAPDRSKKWFVIVPAALFVLIALLVTLIALNFVVSRIRASRDVARNSAANTNSAPVAEPEGETPPLTPKSLFDLKGTWEGTYGPFNNPTKLIINHQQGHDLDGVIEQGSVRVAFKGICDPLTRSVQLTQTEVLSGADWSLGVDVGTLSDDGRKLTGTGKDEVGGMIGIAYNWTFERVTGRPEPARN